MGRFLCERSNDCAIKLVSTEKRLQQMPFFMAITEQSYANVVSINVQKIQVFNYGIDGCVIFAAISQKLNLQYDLETSLHFIGRKETGNGFHRYFPDSFSNSSRWSERLYLGQ